MSDRPTSQNRQRDQKHLCSARKEKKKRDEKKGRQEVGGEHNTLKLKQSSFKEAKPGEKWERL